MKVAWNLNLPDKRQQQQLNEKLAQFRKPFLTILTVIMFFLAVWGLVNRTIKKRYETPVENA